MNKIHSVLRYVAYEIFNRLIIEKERYSMDSWKNILDYQHMVDCILRNGFKDLFEIMSENDIIADCDLYESIRYLYNVDRNRLYDIISRKVEKIKDIYDMLDKYDLCEIYNRIANDEYKINDIFMAMLECHENKNILDFMINVILVNHNIKINNDVVKKLLINYKNRNSIYLYAAIKVLK
ncbi:MAG: hypothetical protein QXD03_02060 [Candidatus Anstonellales archaeon]